jgi:hypothetical protein
VVGSWVLKLLVGIALAGLLVYELGSPLVVRLQAEDVAQDAADRAAHVYAVDGDAAAARAEARQVVRDRGARLRRFRISRERRITVTVAKHAPAIVLDRVGALESWYDVRADARSGADEDDIDVDIEGG